MKLEFPVALVVANLTNIFLSESTHHLLIMNQWTICRPFSFHPGLPHGQCAARSTPQQNPALLARITFIWTFLSIEYQTWFNIDLPRTENRKKVTMPKPFLPTCTSLHVVLISVLNISFSGFTKWERVRCLSFGEHPRRDWQVLHGKRNFKSHGTSGAGWLERPQRSVRNALIFWCKI